MTNRNETIIPIYSKYGRVDGEVHIKDRLKYVDGRVCKGNKGYYKGTGVPYQFHSIENHPKPSEGYVVLNKRTNFYSGWKVQNPNFVGKYGIFKEPFIWHYTDWIGACGQKEGLAVMNSLTFARSSMDIIDYTVFDEERRQAYFTLNYRCGRKKYSDTGDPKELADLIAYMLQEGQNFLWDKRAISDISADGLVTDPADLFQSKDLIHQLGTVYSVLYSMAMMHPNKYIEFMEYMGLHHQDIASIMENSIAILQDNGIDISELNVYDERMVNYRYVILNYLVKGKNAAHCACDMWTEHGNKVMKMYEQKFSKDLEEYEINE